MTDQSTTDGQKAETTRGGSEQRRSRYAHPTIGFGMPATTDPHHFQVTIPKASQGVVLISEHLGLQAQDQSTAIVDRVVLDRKRWMAIRSEVQRAFNVRLKERRLKTANWKVGVNKVDRLLGKELCVLAWAIEGMNVDNIAIAVRNWLALRPEERWWLFGMAAISTGGVKDGDKGWRIALRHALGDVAQNELMLHRRETQTTQEQDDPRLSLFE